MKRLINYDLSQWVVKSKRKPLIIRGARQIGKTHAVRELGKTFVNFVEINFEKTPELYQIFEKNLDPKRIITNLAVATGQKIIPEETLLFFDEIQACPRAIIALRYFYEEMPSLHVIAAGSLLEFAIEQVGVPVGRVAFCYMYPVSFMEYLAAQQNTLLFAAVLSQKISEPMPAAIHEKCMDLLGEYMLLGGMPEILNEWLNNKNILACTEIQHTIIDTYRNDFLKYAKKLQIKYVENLFDQIPHTLAALFKFGNVTGNYRKRELDPALGLLTKAGIVQKVFQTAANGIPLGAEANLERYKCLLLDVALVQSILGLELQDWLIDAKNAFVNKGPITEALVGQELLAYSPSFKRTNLYYWHRSKRGSSAEVDYVIQLDSNIVPVEVKSGKGSTLKSLYMFLEARRQTPFGLRFSVHNYSVIDKLHSYPLYAIASLLAQYDQNLHSRLMALV